MMNEKKEKAASWFKQIQDQICTSFEQLEQESQNFEPFQAYAPGKFEPKDWQRIDHESGGEGGGGQMRVMRGAVFEKVGVNVSTVHGKFPEAFRSKIPGAEKTGEFWASGISLVAHTRSPLMPSVHMNTRMIATEKSWFGGGADLNPMLFDYADHQRDAKQFHDTFEACCNRHDPEYYPKFKAWADEYFYIPHRQMARGVGGIFADYLWNEPETGEDLWDKHFAFIQDIGKSFDTIFPKILRQYMAQNWTDSQRKEQAKRRGYYAEFNLVYDRGTEFGLKTNGNTEAILVSMPPIAEW